MQTTPALIQWYESHKRDLPWRSTSDPYKIWVAEVILQQTRVQQGLSYYLDFIEWFPDVRSLASAPIDKVLKAWQGLGYYSRARNMHRAAGEIMDRFGGRFPREYDEMIKLSGIGDYTAAAISSFAFNKAYPVLDGNVARFVTRLYGITDPIDSAGTTKLIRELLSEMIDRSRPADFNQAMMEFGALQCVPRNPDCDACIFREQCTALREGKVSEIPVKGKKQKVKKLYYDYYVPLWKENGRTMTLISKRSGSGIWKGLYDFPLIRHEGEPEKGIGPDKVDLKEVADKAFSVEESEVYRHVLSHREIMARFIVLRLQEMPVMEQGHGLTVVSTDDLASYPVSRLVENFLRGKFVDFLSKDKGKKEG